MQMKKLLPILIGLSLTGFSTMSQAENLLQVYQQARTSNPDLRKSAADRDAEARGLAGAGEDQRPARLPGRRLAAAHLHPLRQWRRLALGPGPG